MCWACCHKKQPRVTRHVGPRKEVNTLAHKREVECGTLICGIIALVIGTVLLLIASVLASEFASNLVSPRSECCHCASGMSAPLFTHCLTLRSRARTL